jgi:hypothetical protein
MCIFFLGKSSGFAEGLLKFDGSGIGGFQLPLLHGVEERAGERRRLLIK